MCARGIFRCFSLSLSSSAHYHTFTGRVTELHRSLSSLWVRSFFFSFISLRLLVVFFLFVRRQFTFCSIFYRDFFSRHVRLLISFGGELLRWTSISIVIVVYFVHFFSVFFSLHDLQPFVLLLFDHYVPSFDFNSIHFACYYFHFNVIATVNCSFEPLTIAQKLCSFYVYLFQHWFNCFIIIVNCSGLFFFAFLHLLIDAIELNGNWTKIENEEKKTLHNFDLTIKEKFLISICFIIIFDEFQRNFQTSNFQTKRTLFKFSYEHSLQYWEHRLNLGLNWSKEMRCKEIALI